jgi:hypothetical protein
MGERLSRFSQRSISTPQQTSCGTSRGPSRQCSHCFRRVDGCESTLWFDPAEKGHAGFQPSLFTIGGEPLLQGDLMIVTWVSGGQRTNEGDSGKFGHQYVSLLVNRHWTIKSTRSRKKMHPAKAAKSSLWARCANVR